MDRRAKIVATIGPASCSREVLEKLIDAGMDVARFGLAHGKTDFYLDTATLIRKIAAEKHKQVAILCDLPGPKIRTTDMGEGVQFEVNSQLMLRSGNQPSSANCVYTTYETLAQDIQPGDVLALGDGGVSMTVTSVSGQDVIAHVDAGGTLKGKPGLHMPSERVNIPVPTDQDRELIKKIVLPLDAEFVAVSFVRTADEVSEVKDIVGKRMKVCAKIETPMALDNLDEIVSVSDAVMVARGDLGTECPFEDVPVYQKRIIRTSIAYAVPVITATQMLESMISAATPTRAEASDVANAVCDGTDAIMLSGETAIGHDPALCVQTMNRIADQAEIVTDFELFAHSIERNRKIPQISAALIHATHQAAIDANVAAILCFTRSGATVNAMASLRPETQLIALSPNEKVLCQCALTWGVEPVALEHDDDPETMIAEAIERVEQLGYVEAGDVVAVLSGSPGVSGSTDVLRLIRVGERWA